MEKIEFKVDLTAQDLVEYNIKLAYGRVSTWVLMGISVLLVSFTLYGLIYRPENIEIDWTVLLTAALAASYLFLLPTLIKASSKSIFNKNPLYRSPFFYEFSESGIKLVVNEKQNVIKWDNLYKFAENETNFLVHIARGRAYIIPKRCLAGEEMIWDIKQMVKSKVDLSRLSLKYKVK